jgi:hypothetical protein
MVWLGLLQERDLDMSVEVKLFHRKSPAPAVGGKAAEYSDS